MVDITHKSNTKREATARAIVKVSQQATIDAIENKTVPKGDVFEMAKTAGLFAVKRTSDMLPDCHPLPVEFTAVRSEIHGLEIHIEVEVKTIYKTGVEVEAMHGASVVALTMYDMLKPIDKGIEINNIKLLKKSGGKSDFVKPVSRGLKVGVVVCSDAIVHGNKKNTAGQAVIEGLAKHGLEPLTYNIIADDFDQIQEHVRMACADQFEILILAGGTGLTTTDVTPQAVRPMLDFEIPGMAEVMRSHGQDRTPYSMFSRSLCGIKDDTLIIALPGSSRGAEESMDVLFPGVLHLFRIRQKIKST